MKSQSLVTSGEANGKNINMRVLENERKQLKQETLEWISLSALTELRRAWAINEDRN